MILLFENLVKIEIEIESCPYRIDIYMTTTIIKILFQVNQNLNGDPPTLLTTMLFSRTILSSIQPTV